MADEQISNISSAKSLSFFTDSVRFEVKSGDKPEYFIEGYASCPGIDLVNDFVTEKCLKDMESQIVGKLVSVKIGLEHDVIVNKDSRLLPYAKIVEGRFDGKGLFIKAKMNENHPMFNNVWGSITDGFLDAYSIEYKPLDFEFIDVEGKRVRKLDRMMLAGIGLTGRPINTDCMLTGFFKKALEVDSMEEIKAPPVEAKAEVKEVKSDAKEVLEMKSHVQELETKAKELEAKNAELEAKNKELAAKLEMKAQIKAEIKELVPEEKAFKDESKASDSDKAILMEAKSKFSAPASDNTTRSMVEARFGKAKI